MGSLLFSPESSYTWDFMYFPRVEFLFPQVLWKSFNQTLLAFKARFSGYSTRCWTPRLGSLTRGSELPLLWDNFCGIIIFWFVGGPSGGYGNWFDHDSTPLTRLLWLFFVCLFLDWDQDHGVPNTSSRTEGSGNSGQLQCSDFWLPFLLGRPFTVWQRMEKATAGDHHLSHSLNFPSRSHRTQDGWKFQG